MAQPMRSAWGAHQTKVGSQVGEQGAVGAAVLRGGVGPERGEVLLHRLVEPDGDRFRRARGGEPDRDDEDGKPIQEAHSHVGSSVMQVARRPNLRGRTGPSGLWAA